MSGREEKYKRVHVLIREDLYEKLWEIVKKRYVSPVRKFYIILNEAIEEYLRGQGRCRERESTSSE